MRFLSKWGFARRFRGTAGWLAVVFALGAGPGGIGASGASLVVGAAPDRPIPATGNGLEWMEPVLLEVDARLAITDLDVMIDIEHSDVTDLWITLASPGGVVLTLKEVWPIPWRGLPRANMAGTVFDDEAGAGLTDGEAPFLGRFRPEGGFLSVFDGCETQGTWVLEIYDAYYADAGLLRAVELHFAGTTPEPGSCGLVLVGMLLLRRRGVGRRPGRGTAGRAEFGKS